MITVLQWKLCDTWSALKQPSIGNDSQINQKVSVLKCFICNHKPKNHIQKRSKKISLSNVLALFSPN